MPKRKSLKSLPKADIHLVEPPPLQFEPPHKVLARLTAEQERLVKEIQEHKKAWATRNMVAQNKRQTISTMELTAFKTHHSELAGALAKTNLKIGELNREMRERRAERQNGQRIDVEPPPAANSSRRMPKKECPDKKRDDWADWFLLAAREALTDPLYKDVERTAKSMIESAQMMGVSE
jgi:hypothetical protein